MRSAIYKRILFSLDNPLLTYVRYNARLDADWLSKHAGLDLSGKEIRELKEMDAPKNMETLIKVGVAAANVVESRHFPADFD